MEVDTLLDEEEEPPPSLSDTNRCSRASLTTSSITSFENSLEKSSERWELGSFNHLATISVTLESKSAQSETIPETMSDKSVSELLDHQPNSSNSQIAQASYDDDGDAQDE